MNESQFTVLVVDDEPLKRVSLQVELGEAGYDVVEAADGGLALRQMDARPVDVVVTDLRMPGLDGLAFLNEVKRRWPGIDVILMTAYGTVDTAVEAMKRGAYDYITKPFKTDVLLAKLERLRAYRQSQAADAAPPGDGLGRMAGATLGMRQLFAQIRSAADGTEPVHIGGEPGAGKTLVAETIHKLSPRRGCALVRLNCEVLTDHTVEGELLGVPSSVSDMRRPGRIEQAAGGTLLIENVDRLGAGLQAALAQALVSGQLEMNGGQVPVNTRVITTAKVPLADHVQQGAFREDLYYRLSVRLIAVPPLRDRREDIPALSRRFVEQHAPLAGVSGESPVEISAHAMDALTGYHWPGNVMELEHAIEQALTRCGGSEIRPEHLPAAIRETTSREMGVPVPEVGLGLNQTVADVERTLIEAALRHCSGNQARAAQLLHIPRTTLRDKMAKYGLVGDSQAS
jgi:DNA-binding NtrC family response regulator